VAPFVALSFVVGDYISPASERAAQLLKGALQSKITVGQTGAWLRKTGQQQLHRERQRVVTGQRMRSVLFLRQQD
jgi:lipopolysaccharide export LptBFGC system permease protein LptF